MYKSDGVDYQPGKDLILESIKVELRISGPSYEEAV